MSKYMNLAEEEQYNGQQQQDTNGNGFTKKFIGDTSTYTEEEINNFRMENNIQVVAGTNIPAPFMTWSDGQFPDYVTQVFEKQKFYKPTPIQAQCIPIVLHGNDLIGVAKTGSGKTLAYLQPAIIHINAQPQVQAGEGPIVLVVAPTRELAVQIEAVVEQLGELCNINAACIYGGAGKYDQQTKLKSGVDMIVATPGRLIMFLEQYITDLNRTTYLILDEADRMLDMGFEDQIRKIISYIRKDRQTLLFTATWPQRVMKLGRDICQNDPIHIQIGTEENTLNMDITQTFRFIGKYDKQKAIKKEIQDLQPSDKVIVFCKTKKGAEQVSKDMQRERLRCAAIHGDKSQNERDWVISQFKENKTQVLVATDVASRGLDIKDITLVINYDMAHNIEDYIHRIGRTGRAGEPGQSLTFFDVMEDGGVAQDLINLLSKNNLNVPDELYSAKNNKGFKRQQSGGKPFNSYGQKGGGYGGQQKSYGNNNYKKW